jgi:MerR family transcriptional regulator, light-induced transcriptional regulator
MSRAWPPPTFADVEPPLFPPEKEPASLNLKQAASALGVHYMTVYRYVRQGRLPAFRDGPEWRILETTIQSFRPTDAGVSTRSSTVAWDQRLVSCLLAADEASAWNVIEAALAAGHSPTYCYFDMISSALAKIGALWETDEISVADQFLATAVAVRLVSRLGARFRRPGRSRGTVVFGAPPGELHSLPIAIVSDVVRLQGYDVLELGANVPPEAFVVAATRTPRLICVGIGVTTPESLDSAQNVVTALRAVDADVPIVIGGLAVSLLGETSLRGVSAIAGDGREAVAIIESFASSRAIRRIV